MNLNKGDLIHLNFMPDKRRNLMKVLIAASAIVPIYVIYMSLVC